MRAKARGLHVALPCRSRGAFALLEFTAALPGGTGTSAGEQTGERNTGAALFITYRSVTYDDHSVDAGSTKSMFKGR